MVVVYHYTDDKGKRGIDSSKIIKCAQRHTHHGDGVYFTSLPPKTYTKQEIARNNYRIGAQGNMSRITWVVEVDLPNAQIERCPDPNRNLWRYPNQPLNLKDRHHRIYRFEQGA